MSDESKFLEKYGKVVVKFSSYYKYVFNYKATLPNGDIIFAQVGGDVNSIYKNEVCNDDETSIEDLYAFAAEVRKGGDGDDEGEIIDSFYSY